MIHACADFTPLPVSSMLANILNVSFSRSHSYLILFSTGGVRSERIVPGLISSPVVGMSTAESDQFLP